jgi:hypothetical protein
VRATLGKGFGWCCGGGDKKVVSIVMEFLILSVWRYDNYSQMELV